MIKRAKNATFAETSNLKIKLMDFFILLGRSFFLYNTQRTRIIELVARSGNAHIPVSNGLIPIVLSNSSKDKGIKAGKIAGIKLIRTTTKVVKNNPHVIKLNFFSYLSFFISKEISYQQIFNFSTR